MRSRRHTWLAMLSLGLFACTGDQGPPGTQGPPGVTPDTTGTLSGVVSDGVTSTPLQGVAVTASDSGGASLAQTVTDAAGAFRVTVPAGPVDLTFARTYYTAPPVLHTGVNIGRTVSVAVTMSEAATGKPSLVLTAPANDIGYGGNVTLSAAASDPNGDTLTYAWTNTTWPVLGSVTGSGATATLTAPTRQAAFAARPDSQNPGQYISGYKLEDRFGVIPIIGDTRGQVTAKVTVSDGHGQSASASITVSAAAVTTGVHNVALGTRVYVNSGHDDTSDWSLTRPVGSTATLDDAHSRTPFFTPDVAGKYTLAEGTRTMDLYAGAWQGALVADSGAAVTPDPICLGCHKEGGFAPDKFTPWLATGHATQFTRGINGVLSSSYGQGCIECHTVGYDSGVANGGFDDAAKVDGWLFPAKLDASNWAAFKTAAPHATRLANIQCESCHGPQGLVVSASPHGYTQGQPFVSPRVGYGAEVCATCHAMGAHHIYSEWSTPAAANAEGVAMGHSNRTAAQRLGSDASKLNASCGRCHTAQGYTLYSDLLAQGKPTLASVPAATLAQVTSASAEPVTCVACHDPHEAQNPNQLRVYGDTPMLPSGFAAHGMGKGALCVTCHNSRNGAVSDTVLYLHEDGETYNGGNPTSYSAPHQACQGDVFTGHNAYFLGGAMPMTSRHAAIEDTCVGCHMKLQPEEYTAHGSPAKQSHLFRITDSNQAALCANCHGTSVNGEGIQAQVEAQLAALEAKMGKAAIAKLNAFAGGNIRLRVWDEATDYYSSWVPSGTAPSNVVVNVATNPVTAIALEEIHGQIGLKLTFTQAIVAVPFVTGSGAPAAAKDMQTVWVQLGALKDNATTPAAIYATSGNFVRAGWNYFLVEGDQSKGLHNPSFVSAVLNASVAKDLSY